MIPILFSPSATTFTSNGLGRLSDAIECTVEEQRNGLYELEMRYPMTGRHYAEIENGSIIVARHCDKTDLQPFRVYKITRPLNGIVTIYAQHISYDLTKIVVTPFTAPSITQLFQILPAQAVNACPFTFWTDKTVLGEYKVTVPSSIRSLLGGSEGSILDIYGTGEYEFDAYTVKLHLHRGTNHGVTIRYGKNMTELVHEGVSTSNVTAVLPFWTGAGGDGGETTVYTLSPVVSGLVAAANYVNEGDIAYMDANGNIYQGESLQMLCEPLDLSDQFETAPTEAQLIAAAEAWLADHATITPTVSMKVSFVQLWQTNEYKDFAPLQRGALCDTVNIEYPKLGVTATAEVVKVVYNVLLERYDSMELGTPKTTLAASLAATEQAVEHVTDNLDTMVESMMGAAITAATDLLAGGLGGHVVLARNADGQPNEILVMDTDNIATAMNVLRINMNGIGFSSSGYEGPYESAWTLDGRFVADFITAGKLKAITIEGPNTQTFWDLATGIFQSYGTKNLTSVIETSDSTQETVTYTVESKTRLAGGELTVEGKKTTDTETTVFADAGLQSDDVDYSFYEQIPRDLPHASLVYPHGGLISRGDHVQSFGGTGRNQYPADVDNVRYNPKGILTPDYVQLGEPEGPTFADGDYEGESYPDTVDRNILRLSGGWAERREAILFKKYVDVAYSPQGVVRDFHSPPIICRPAWDIAVREDIEQESVLTVAWLTSNKTKLQFFFPLNRPVSEDVVSFEIAFTLHRAYTATGTGVVTSDQECFSGSGIIHPVSVSFGDFGMRVVVEKVDGSWSSGSNNGFLICELNDVWFRALATDPYE